MFMFIESLLYKINLIEDRLLSFQLVSDRLVNNRRVLPFYLNEKKDLTEHFQLVSFDGIILFHSNDSTKFSLFFIMEKIEKKENQFEINLNEEMSINSSSIIRFPQLFIGYKSEYCCSYLIDNNQLIVHSFDYPNLQISSTIIMTMDFEVKKIGSGNEHLIFQSEKNEFFASGNGSRCQMGKLFDFDLNQLEWYRPKKFTENNLKACTDFRCGGWHTIFFNETHTYGCGWNSFCQLNLSPDDDVMNCNEMKEIPMGNNSIIIPSVQSTIFIEPVQMKQTEN
ncbi:hypothetical protein SNEBB_008169 [Seison nebaliae]|nr:hypothetical protein SNEBB_008169 [Seison nebaliae]